MGYTRYWNRTNKKITETFVNKVKEIISDAEEKGISVCDGWGENAPIVSMHCVSINGSEECDLGNESFVINNKETGFQFCKTARKPYDYVVRKVLKVAEEEGLVNDVKDDGENEEIISDCEYLGIEPIINPSTNNYNLESYIGKKLLFYPIDTYRKEGYLRNVDQYGYIWEVTDAAKVEDIGVRFTNHASNFTFQVIE